MAISRASSIKALIASPDLQTGEFALKCYIAAMLSYYIALRIGLQNPYWALTTCYITAAPQPLAGAIISKAIYRTLGTLVGVTAAVILVPAAVGRPLVLSGLLSLWLGACVYMSIMDRTPRSYLYVLAGYTASIVGFPSVQTPGVIFDVAIAREQEIFLGILCTALVHGALFPRTVTAVLHVRIDDLLSKADECSRQALTGPLISSLQKQMARRTMASQIGNLLTLASQLPFDTARRIPGVKPLYALQDQFALLLPVTSAVDDRVALWAREREGIPLLIQGSLTLVLSYVHQYQSDYEYFPRANRLIATLEQIQKQPLVGTAWQRMLTWNTLFHLGQLVRLHRNFRALRDELRGDSPVEVRAQISDLVASGRSRFLHTDRRSASWVALSAALTVFLSCVFWIATAWPAGAVAAFISGVAAGLFGNLPHAPLVIRRFVVGVCAGILIAALYGYAVLPRVTDPALLAAALAPPLLLFGAVLARPSVSLLGLAAALGFLNTVNLGATYQDSFGVFANTALALLFGAAFTAIIFSVTQMGGANAAALRLLRRAYIDVALRASSDGVQPVEWTSRMIDRVALSSGAAQSTAATVSDLLLDMRTGLLLGALRALRDGISLRALYTLDVVLAEVAQYYRSLDPRLATPAPPTVLASLDHSMQVFDLEDNQEHRREGLTSLIGVRCNLFPIALPYSSDSG
jgi:uncharacterized membrane protein YccC